ncbi:MAG TPA: zf-HC2 domain-containing protein [Acidimicrobiales bacterium]
MTEHVGEALSALVDGELSPAEEADVRAHLADCATCADELVAVERMRSLVRDLPVLDLPPVVVERVREADRPAAARHAPSRVAAMAAAAVAAAASLLFAVMAPQSDTVNPPVERLVEVHATSGVNGDPVTQLVPAAVPVSFQE